MKIAKEKKRCVLAFAHNFFYSSGMHGHNDGNDKPQVHVAKVNEKLLPGKEMREIFKALHANGAAVFLAGHDHHYEQLGRANANVAKVPEKDDLGKSAIAKEDGVRSFVVGTGGTGLYSADYKYRWAFTEAYDLQSQGILKIELRSASYSWKFIPTKDDSASMVVAREVDTDVCGPVPEKN